MNKVVFQLWEELERGENIKNDGCSLHINSTERDIFVKSFYEKRNNSIPDEYEKSSGSFIEAFIDDSLSKTDLRVLGDIISFTDKKGK
jgi:hypothetical protein